MSKLAREMFENYQYLFRTQFVPCLAALLETLIKNYKSPVVLQRTIATCDNKKKINFEISPAGVGIGEGYAGGGFDAIYKKLTPLEFVKKVVYGDPYDDSHYPDLYAAGNLLIDIETLSKQYGIRLT